MRYKYKKLYIKVKDTHSDIDEKEIEIPDGAIVVGAGFVDLYWGSHPTERDPHFYVYYLEPINKKSDEFPLICGSCKKRHRPDEACESEK